MNELIKRLLSPGRYAGDLLSLKRRFEAYSIPFNVETILAYFTASGSRHEQFFEVGPTLLALISKNGSVDLRSCSRDRALAKYVKAEIRNQCYVQREPTRRGRPSGLHSIHTRYGSFLRRLIQNPIFHLSPELPREKPEYPNIEFFTTNYDDVLETFFEWVGVPVADGYRDTIPPSGAGNEITCTFDENEFDDMNALRIYKLYGSIMYARSRGRILKVTPYTWSLPGSRRKFGDLLIYPGATKVIWNEPQLQLFYRLHQRLRDPATKYCVVIGYSFRDRAVADIFTNSLALNGSLRIFIVGREARSIVHRVFRNHPSVRAVNKRFEKLDPVGDFR